MIPTHARRRLFLVSPLDGSSQAALGEAPRAAAAARADPRPHPRPGPRAPRPVQHDRARARPRARARHPDVRRRSEVLPLGTKSGCRRLFAEEGVPHPLGREDLDERRRRRRGDRRRCAPSSPGIAQVIVKLNEGVSGEGNAIVDLAGLPDGCCGRPRSRSASRARCSSSSRRSRTTSYVEKLAERGGVVEERIRGEEFRSPSVQLRVTPLGRLEVLSTHDQLLGGAERPELPRLRLPRRPGLRRRRSRGRR